MQNEAAMHGRGRKDDTNCMKAFTRLVVDGTAHVGRQKKTWRNTASAEMRRQKVDPRGIHDRMISRAIGW